MVDRRCVLQAPGTCEHVNQPLARYLQDDPRKFVHQQSKICYNG